MRDLFFPPQPVVPPVVAAAHDVAGKRSGGGSADGIATAVREPPRLIGIVIRRRRGEAYFLDGDRAYTVHEGDSLTEHYRVERIEAKKVSLRDLDTGRTRTIDWSGDE